MYAIKLSNTALKELTNKRKAIKDKAIYDRLQCIYLASKGKGNKEITETLGINKNSATNWIKLYIEKGLDELCRPENFDRRTSKINDYVDKIKQDVKDNTIATLGELQAWIKKEYSIEMEQSWLFRCCKKNSIYLTRKLD